MVQIEEIPSEPVIVPVKKKENVSPKKEKADIKIEEKVKPKAMVGSLHNIRLFLARGSPAWNFST